MTDPQKLIVPAKSLAIFIDDAGHEGLLREQPVYALGGCVALGRDLDRLIYTPWRAIRKRVTGSPDTRLHASEFARGARPGDIEAIAEFFRSFPFARVGAAVTIDTRLPIKLAPMRAMKAVLQERINDLVVNTLCKQVQIVFEASQRTNAQVEQAFQDFELHRGTKLIPSECFFMPKKASDCGLEVADFIVHAVYRQARQMLKDPSTFLPDFCAVFHSVDPKLISFMMVDEVTHATPAESTPPPARC